MSEDFAPYARRIVVRVLILSSVVSGTGVAQAALSGGSPVASSIPTAATPRGESAGEEATPATRRRSRIAHLATRWDSISQTRGSESALRYDAITTDTVEAGVFRIRTSASLRRRVVPAAHDASRELQFDLDVQSLAAIRANDLFVVQSTDSVSAWRREPLLTGGRRDGVWCCDIESVSRFRADPLHERLSDLAVTLVSQSFDSDVRGWLLQSSLPLLADPTRPEKDARIELGTSESYQARACLAGSDRACSLLLDLHGRPADPMVTWYAREDYRALVARVRLAPTDGRDAPRQQRECLAGAIDMCESLLHALDRSRIPSPTLQGPRLSLLRHALRLGGIGALQRLRSTTGDIGTRLAAASRTDEQRLLQSWRSTMTDPATASVQPTWSIATAALFFTIALAALGLRSTKR